MRSHSGDKQVFGATAIALVILLVGTSMVQSYRLNSRLQSDSAESLAESSFELEKEDLKQRAIELGNPSSPEVTSIQWKRLRSRMENLGATTETVEGVLAKVAASKEWTIEYASSYQKQLWPLAVNSGYVKAKKVWIIHLAYWIPYLPTSGWCATGDDDPFRQLAHRTYVLDNEAPYRCWVRPFNFQFLEKDEQKQYIEDK